MRRETLERDAFDGLRGKLRRLCHATSYTALFLNDLIKLDGVSNLSSLMKLNFMQFQEYYII